MSRLIKAVLLVPLALAMPACGEGGEDSTCDGDNCDELNPIGDGPQYDRYRTFKDNVAGIPGILPPNDQLAKDYADLDELEREGLATWHLFAGDGVFLRENTYASKGVVNVLKLVDAKLGVPRNKRFESFGTLNDPGCKPNATTDKFGLTLDDCADPYSSGILGLRLKPNVKFDQELEVRSQDGKVTKTGVNNQKVWEAIGGAKGAFGDMNKTLKVTVEGKKLELKGWEVEPPYLPSLACTVCHVGPHPLNPPKDINNPKWNEVAFAIGNQFFREGNFLGNDVHEGDFAREVLFSQPPGTSDTSRVPNDHLFNPNVVNAVAKLRARPLFKEKALPGRFTHDRIPCSVEVPRTGGEFIDQLLAGNDPRKGSANAADGECVPTMYVLKDGADSSGPSGALLRVYINVGSCALDMKTALKGEFLTGTKGQQPIDRQKLHDDCKEYIDLEKRVTQTLLFLSKEPAHQLAEAPGVESCRTPSGGKCILNPNDPADAPVLRRGALVFAENCGSCHISNQPTDVSNDNTIAANIYNTSSPFNVFTPGTWFTDPRKAHFRSVVLNSDGSLNTEFLREDFMSDDRRYPVNVLGINVARAMGSNAVPGHIWQDYASQTYAELPAVTGVSVSIPFLGSEFELPLTNPGNGRGYYRTASLRNVWNSAPFLHNNSVGLFNGRFDLEGRIAAYEDAATKLLNPDQRLGDATVRRTGDFSRLDTGMRILGGTVALPLVPLPSGTSIDLVANLGVLLGLDTGTTGLEPVDKGVLAKLLAAPGNILENLRDHLAGTDPIQDKGHEFGSQLSPDDKRALIEYMKLF